MKSGATQANPMKLITGIVQFPHKDMVETHEKFRVIQEKCLISTKRLESQHADEGV